MLHCNFKKIDLHMPKVIKEATDYRALNSKLQKINDFHFLLSSKKAFRIYIPNYYIVF